MVSLSHFVIVILMGFSRTSSQIHPFVPMEDVPDEIEFFPLDESIREKMHFLLWTPQNSIEAQILTVNNALTTNFDPNLPTKVFIHGYTSNGHSLWAQLFRDEYFKRDNYNLISVDWEILAAYHYPDVLPYLPAVGEHVAELITSLLNTFSTQISISSFHIIGHSLGAHVGGNTGRILNAQIPRISAMDPAGFLMQLIPEEYKIGTDKALLVDVIHSAGLWIALNDPVGHIDFYPNRGIASQPGCENDDGPGLGCSHRRCWELYAESINSDMGFKAWQCDSWDSFEDKRCKFDEVPINWMGEDLEEGAHGSFYLRTSNSHPFALPNP